MACYYAGSLNDSGITVKECARYSGLKSRSANNTGSMRFGNRRPWLNQREFRPMAEVPFRPARQLSEYKGKGASASREIVRMPISDSNVFCQYYPEKYFNAYLYLTLIRCETQNNKITLLSTVTFFYLVTS